MRINFRIYIPFEAPPIKHIFLYVTYKHIKNMDHFVNSGLKLGIVVYLFWNDRVYLWGGSLTY